MTDSKQVKFSYFLCTFYGMLILEESSMFLNNTQVEERLKSEKNLANASWLPCNAKSPETQVTITEKTIHSPGKNGVNLSKEERTEIAIQSRLGESQVAIARDHGITQANVSSIERGKTKGIDEKKVEGVISSVKDRALDRLMTSLGLLSDDKLSGCSAKDLSVIASNMGRVVEKITPKETAPDNINFIIYSPELKQERAYDVIEI